jgi:hypothetical protein
VRLFWLKLKLSIFSIARMYRAYPATIVLTFFLSIIIFAALLWIFNIGLLYYALFQAPLSVSEKSSFIMGVFGSAFTNFDTPQALALFMFSVLFGVNLSMLIFVKQSKKTGLSLMLAVLASGCAACGTSVLTPLLISVGAGGSLALSREIGIAISYLSLTLVVYSIYSLGGVVANTLATIPKKTLQE